MKTQIFSTNGSHKLATFSGGTSTVTLGGTLDGGTASLQFMNGGGNMVDVGDTAAMVVDGSAQTVLHGIDRPLFITIVGGGGNIDARTQTTLVK